MFAVGAFLAPVMRDPAVSGFVAATGCVMACVLHTFLLRQTAVQGPVAGCWSVVVYACTWAAMILLGSLDVFRRADLTDRAHCVTVWAWTGVRIGAMMMALAPLLLWMAIR